VSRHTRYCQTCLPSTLSPVPTYHAWLPATSSLQARSSFAGLGAAKLGVKPAKGQFDALIIHDAIYLTYTTAVNNMQERPKQRGLPANDPQPGKVKLYSHGQQGMPRGRSLPRGSVDDAQQHTSCCNPTNNDTRPKKTNPSVLGSKVVSQICLAFEDAAHTTTAICHCWAAPGPQHPQPCHLPAELLNGTAGQ